MNITAIILAAGSGARLNAGKNKLLVEVGGKTVIEHTLKPFLLCDRISKILLVHSKTDEDFFKSLQCEKIGLALGGSTRTQSVKNALKCVDQDTDIVVIHDGARPFVTQEIIEASVESCQKFGSGVAAVFAQDTLARASLGGEITDYIDRSSCLMIQTPQSFFLKDIVGAYDKIRAGETFTDDSSVFGAYVQKPHYCEGGAENKKITYMSDLSLFDRNPSFRIGTGQDTHLFQSGRKLILGGVEIPSEEGLLGHSDADVLTHAVMDSLLSAAHARDIGYHFPDTDAQYKDVSSLVLLDKVTDILRAKRVCPVHVSAVIVADRPKLSPFIEQMQRNLSAMIGVPVSVTATTTEGKSPDCITVTASALCKEVLWQR